MEYLLIFFVALLFGWFGGFACILSIILWEQWKLSLKEKRDKINKFFDTSAGGR